MKAIGMLLLSIGLVGSLCGCQTTIPNGGHTPHQSYLWPRDQAGKPYKLPSITQQQATVQASIQERARAWRPHPGAESVPPSQP